LLKTFSRALDTRILIKFNKISERNFRMTEFFRLWLSERSERMPFRCQVPELALDKTCTGQTRAFFISNFKHYTFVGVSLPSLLMPTKLTFRDTKTGTVKVPKQGGVLIDKINS
jgi:hypothetical protein